MTGSWYLVLKCGVRAYFDTQNFSTWALLQVLPHFVSYIILLVSLERNVSQRKKKLMLEVVSFNDEKTDTEEAKKLEWLAALIGRFACNTRVIVSKTSNPPLVCNITISHYNKF